VNTFALSDAMHVLAAIRVYHQPQDTSDATAQAWSMALSHAGITSRTDAVHAVVTHYTTPGKDRWITPADVVAGVRQIRRARLEHSDQILPTTDPDDVRAWMAARRAGVKALGDGAITALPAPSGEVAPRLRAALPSVFRRPQRPLSVTAEGGEKPPVKATPARTVTESDAARMEAERERQQSALQAVIAASQLESEAS